MNLVLMPMWLLSGAFFPLPSLSGGESLGQVALHWLMRLNPLTYCVAGVRRLWGAGELPTGFYQPTQPTAWIVAILFAVLLQVAAVAVCAKRSKGDWQ